jgi:hypothetical protein
MSELDRGEISIVIKGQSLAIIPSLILIEGFEKEFGSIYKVFDKFSQGEIAISEIRNMICFLIEQTDNKTIKPTDIEDEILQNGAIVFYEPLSLFLAMVVAGQKGMAAISKGLSSLGDSTLGEP